MEKEKTNLYSLLAQANSMRFKLLAIIGKNDDMKNKIINSLKDNGWILIDVEKELLELRSELEENDEISVEIGTKIKDWFNSKPNNIILTNSSILYHDLFMKSSPIGAFKYNSRNKNCVLFLEDEKKIGSRLHFGNYGSKEYWDQDIQDIIMVDIDNIDENLIMLNDVIPEYDASGNPVSQYFNFEVIKDVVDIDNDLKDKDRKKNIVSSFIISDSLEGQIIDFFDELEKPTHKSRNIIGNYGSGKSHLVGFLVSLTEEKNLYEYIKNKNVKNRVEKFNRNFLTVHFELQAGQTELRRWFFDKIRIQIKNKYNIDLPKIDFQNQYDDKDNIISIMKILKDKFPEKGLLVVMDEVSDFLLSKQREFLRQDLQFLRVIGQVTQDEDLMIVCSMQEDIFSSPKFKDVAGEISRVKERFQNIIIHKEDVEKVISERIVPKTDDQKIKLENDMSDFIKQIEEVSKNINEYIDLYPLTPFLLELFTELPYFEKRGVIQFAMEEIKKSLKISFPFFLTFEKIYDILTNDPNKKNLPEIYEIVKAMSVLSEKIKLLDDKYQKDAIRIVKALAVFSLWETASQGVISKELANKLMILPTNKRINPADNINLIIKKIREVTDGEYIKINKDEAGNEFIRFDVKTGIDPEEKIAQKSDAVSNDELEEELFTQLKSFLDLDELQPNIFEDESGWKSKKSFRKGKVLFYKSNSEFDKNISENDDYIICIIAPSHNDKIKQFNDIQLEIKLNIDSPEAIQILREIVAIKQLINLGFQQKIMERKLKERIEGTIKGGTPIKGFIHRINKLFLFKSECLINGNEFKIDKYISNKDENISQIFTEIKTEILDEYFNKKYPLHPVYSVKLTGSNIGQTLDSYLNELKKGDFSRLQIATKNFLKNLEMLNQNDYPSINNSKLCNYILDIIKRNSDKLTKINSEIVKPLEKPEYGLEKEIVYFILSVFTILGKTVLKSKGITVDINNIATSLNSLKSFETISYIQLQKEQSFTIAVEIIKAFGLNGEKILQEKTRIEIFREYKEKVAELLSKINKINSKYEEIKVLPKVYIEIQSLTQEINEINSISWNEFDIKNYQNFISLEKYSDRILDIKKSLDKIDKLHNALNDYDFIVQKRKYIEDALEKISDNEILNTDKEKIENLETVKTEIEEICNNIDRFLDNTERNTIKGKFDKFLNIYVHKIYYPAHEKYVGKNVNWEILDNILKSDTFKALSQLIKISKQINDSKFKKLRNSLETLKSFRCLNNNLAYDLKNNTVCPKCYFPKDNNYSKYIAEINNIEKEFEDLLKEYEQTILSSIRSYRDNIKFLDNDEEKGYIKRILENKKLPNQIISNDEIKTINKLFKEIDLVNVRKDDFMKSVFPNEKIVSISDIRENFNKWILSLIDNKPEENIRVKLENDNEEN